MASTPYTADRAKSSAYSAVERRLYVVVEDGRTQVLMAYVSVDCMIRSNFAEGKHDIGVEGWSRVRRH